MFYPFLLLPYIREAAPNHILASFTQEFLQIASSLSFVRICLGLHSNRRGGKVHIQIWDVLVASPTALEQDARVQTATWLWRRACKRRDDGVTW